MNKYKIKNKIALGADSDIFLVQDKMDEKYAVKVVPKKMLEK